MTTTLFDISTGTYQRVLQSTINVMQKGREHFEANDVPLQEMVEFRLCEDMMPLHFQIISVVHHSHGALTGVANGEFSPPSFAIDKSYDELQRALTDALAGVQSFTEDQVNGFEETEVIFNLGKRKMPFDGGAFLKTFSLPNFYFHATTVYDILRLNGVPLGKMDFLVGMQIKGQ
ncbi:MAG: DUF1993 domain-containing protein [Pseudomonadales bacterium]|jgi:hypothetical protein